MAENHGVIADLWTHRQTAAFLKVTPGTLYVWLSKGTGPRSFKIGGSRRYDPRDVQEFVRQRTDHATAIDPRDAGHGPIRPAAVVNLDCYVVGVSTTSPARGRA